MGFSTGRAICCMGIGEENVKSHSREFVLHIPYFLPTLCPHDRHAAVLPHNQTP